MDGGGCYIQGDIIIKQEPDTDEDYGTMSQEYQEGPGGDCHRHDLLVMSQTYSGDHDNMGNSQKCSTEYSGIHDYKVVSYDFENEGIGKYSIVKTEYSPTDSDDDYTVNESSPHISKGEAAEETVDADVGHPVIKEESVDDSYNIANNHTNVHIKEEVFTLQGSQQNLKEEMEEDEDEVKLKKSFKRQQRLRKVKRNPSFEYENDSPCSRGEGLEHETSTEFEIYMDREEEHEHGMCDNSVQSQDSGSSHSMEERLPCDKEDNSKMIARYALYDVENSEMVGIKSVNPKVCEICNKQFQYEFHKKFHMQKVHPETLENDKRKNSREDDSRNKGGKGKFNPRARYSKTCFICRNKIYTHPYYLNLHMQEVHPEWLIDNKMIQNLTADDNTDTSQTGNKNKVCPVCHEEFRFAFQLKYHIQKAHAEILVEDKRVDTTKLPSREESEITVDDEASRLVKPVVSTSPLGGIKLTYTVQDILNIKRNMEKETAAKEAKEAQRLAKCLEPKKRLGRPPKSPGTRGPGRPRKVSREGNRVKEAPSDSLNNSEEISKGIEIPLASGEFCMHIKEEPADNGHDAVSVRIDDDDTTSQLGSDRHLSNYNTSCEEVTNPGTLNSDIKCGIYACSPSYTQKTDGEGATEMRLSESGCKQEEFRVGEEKASSAENHPQERRSDIDESTSSTCTVSDVLEADTEGRKDGPESVPVQTHSTRPKRKRKKKELKDMLPLSPVKRRKLKTKTDPTSTQECVKSKSDKRSAKNTNRTVAASSAHIYCGQCGRIFVNSQKFQQHEAQCLTLEAPSSHAGYYPCHKCQKVFQHVAAQQLHMLRDHPDISHTCPFCGKVFAYQSVMKKHLYTHTNEAVKKAITALKEDSTASTAGQESVLINLISDLGVEGDTESNGLENKIGGLEMSVPLNNLKKGLAVLRSLPEVLGPSGLAKDEIPPQVHLMKSEGRSQISKIDTQEFCPGQGSEAADGSLYAVEDDPEHNQSSQSPQTVPPSSSVTCSSSFPSLSPVSKSTPSSSSPTKTYLCKKCDGVFPGLPLLYKHEMESHLSFICHYCSKGFVYENMLRKHMAIHREADKHVCMWCGKKFSYITGLKNHALTHNGSLESHKLMCNKCGMCWYDTEGYLPQASKQLIGEHMQECFQNIPLDDLQETNTAFGAKHTLQRCLDCDKIYNLNSEHSRNVKMTHVFRCKICDFELKKVSDLKNHVFGHHDEAKQFVSDYKEDQIFNCRLCSEHFAYLFEFMCHMADHKKENLEDRKV
ncbi:uncharacterized protein [Haliotis asinina]|uniref:uncharacterized protein n=1 Tax=Haliotis asinina TaxID=109174 RepID=UPI00353262A7